MDDAAPAPPEARTPALPPELPPPPLERVNDFPDGLSPMLVKELRQGLRTYTFVILFLVLQGLLALVLLTVGAAAGDHPTSGAGTIVSKIVFCFYTLALLVIQPLRGISAIAVEIKQNTIDLMVMTRLSAWRIVWGKWSSIVSQSALLLLAVLPYLILRYFFGGMQLFSELFLMFYIFLVSGTLTAITVGLSAVSSVLVRGLLPIIGAVILGSFVLFGFTPELQQYVGYLSPSSDTFYGALGFLALTLYVGYFFLDMGASMIAPMSENRATRKRLIGLVMLTVSFWILQLMDPSAALVGSLLVLFLIALDVLTERSDFPRVVCAPFLRFGGVGRLAGRFLYPGHGSGALFFAAMVVLLAFFLLAQNRFQAPDLRMWAFLGVWVAVMVFPAALIQLCARKSEQRFPLYVSLMLIGFLLALMLGILFDSIANDSLLWAFAPVAPVLLPLIDSQWNAGNRETITAAIWIIAGFYYLVILAGALPLLKRMGRLEREQLNREEPADHVA